MSRYDHRKCEDDQDASRMAEVILRTLGYTDVKLGSNTYDVRYQFTATQLLKVAQHAERIARWARAELKGLTNL